MQVIEITQNIYHAGLNICQKDYLFEGLWPIPHGVSLNAYLVKGEKIALIDSWCSPENNNIVDVDDLGKHSGFYERTLASIGINPDAVQYVIINHLEPDHSGWLGQYFKNHPEVQLICTAKAAPMLRDFYGITENIRTVKTGDSLDLGNGKELIFYEAPNVHWPETMVTWEKSSGVLFSCDAFGSYGAIKDHSIFDSDLNEDEIRFYEAEALRYYANIVASFSKPVLNALDALQSIPIKIIAPSHGLIWKRNPSRIVELYRTMANYATTGGEKRVCLLWSSMYGNTEKMVKFIRLVLKELNVPFTEHRIPQTHTGIALADIWRSKGLIIAMPTYEYRMFPPMTHLLADVQLKHMFHKKVLRLGSYGWVGGAEKHFQTAIQDMDWELIPSLEWPGQSKDESFEAIKKRIECLVKSL